jgi:crotonobetainyl-CoA:carnitine CoA-transferase CaiB-like acyl-CoA transferase
MIDTVPHPQGPLRVLSNPIKIDGDRLPNRAAPKLGCDTDALLGEIGYSSADISQLRNEGTV